MARRMRAVVRGWLVWSVALLPLAALGLLPAVPGAAAGSTVVSNCQDDGSATTLRVAIANANAGDTITFTPGLNCTGANAIVLTVAQGGTLTLSKNLTIDATGRTIVVDGGCTVDTNSNCTAGGVSVFQVNSGVTATLTALTLQHGTGTGTCGGGPTGGGAIANAGMLTVANSTLANNRGGSDGGGGIYACGGTLTVTDSTFTGNQAPGTGDGGAIRFATSTNNQVTGSTFTQNTATTGGAIMTGPSVAVTDSTFVGNTATLGGGAIWNQGGTTTVTNCTLSGNAAPAGQGGGIRTQITHGDVVLTNTIVANSTGGDLFVRGGTITGSHNLIGDGSGGIVGSNGNISGNPLLGTLGGYGSTNGTQTLPLLPGSPAIDAGTTGAGVPATDQRGKPRVNAPDIGAFESQGFTLASVAGSTPQSALVGTAFANPLALTVTAKDTGEPVQGGIVAFAAPLSGASATLSAPTATISGGQASVNATANGTAGGPYSVTASATGATSVAFSLTNTPPTITLAPTTLPNGTAETLYPTQTLTASGGTGPYTFTVPPGSLPTGLTLASDGTLSGTPTQAGPFTVTVTATDAHGFTGNQQYSFTIAAPTITLGPTTLPAGVKGVAYPTTTLTASGGTAPFAFIVPPGTLPPGLTLVPDGTLSGTPTATGSFTFTVTATDKDGFTGTRQYTVMVTAAPLVSIAVTPANGSVKVGATQQYTATGTYQDGSTLDLTGAVAWSSDATAIASVNGSGKGTGMSPGTAHITAAQGNVSGQTTVTVSAPTPIGIAPAPQPASRPAGTGGEPGATPAPGGTGRGGPTGGTAPAPVPTGR